MFLAAHGLVTAQTSQAPDALLRADSMPVFRATAVAQTAKAINYRHRSGATKIDFAGTSLMPKARGKAKVQGGEQAGLHLKLKSNLTTCHPPTEMALNTSPMCGRTGNLGEVLVNETKSKLND